MEMDANRGPQLTVDEFRERCGNALFEHYRSFFGLMHGVVLGVGAILLIPLVHHPDQRLLLWVAALTATILTAQANATGGVLLNGLPRLLDSVIPTMLIVAQLSLFGLLQDEHLVRYWPFGFAGFALLSFLLVRATTWRMQHTSYEPALAGFVKDHITSLRRTVWAAAGSSVLFLVAGCIPAIAPYSWVFGVGALLVMVPALFAHHGDGVRIDEAFADGRLMQSSCIPEACGVPERSSPLTTHDGSVAIRLRQFEVWFPGINERIWPWFVDMLEARAAEAERSALLLRDYSGISGLIVTPDFDRQVRLHVDGFRSVTAENLKRDLTAEPNEVGDWFCHYVETHERAVGRRVGSSTVLFWYGAGEAFTPWNRLWKSVGALLAAFVLIVGGGFLATPAVFRTAGAGTALLSGYLTYWSLDSNYQKIRNSIARGYWLETGLTQQIIDRLAVWGLALGTIAWAVGDITIVRYGCMFGAVGFFLHALLAGIKVRRPRRLAT